MKKRIVTVAAALTLLGSAAPMSAHHSVNAQFNTQVELTITGTLAKVDNVNPHSWWYVDVKDANGKVTRWNLESTAPAGLVRQGLKLRNVNNHQVNSSDPSEIKAGKTYSFRICPGWKDAGDAKLGFMKALTVDGKEYVMVEL